MNDDVRAINNLVFSYAELFDLGDFDSAVRLFEHKVDGRWRFVDRVIHSDHMGDVSHHIRH